MVAGVSTAFGEPLTSSTNHNWKMARVRGKHKRWSALNEKQIVRTDSTATACGNAKAAHAQLRAKTAEIV